MARLNFNSAEVEPNQDVTEPIPPGEYTLMVSESDVKATKAGTGTYLAVILEVLEGDYKGRKIFVNFNLRNPNSEAERIGQGQLSGLCRACGILGMVEDSSELHGIPFQAKVKVKPASGEYGPKNEISSYKPRVTGAVAVGGKEKAKKVGNGNDDLPF